jgi:hypothetical protein
LTPSAGIAQALHDMPLAAALRGVPWLYPTVETVHIACIALLFGSIAVVDLRLLGVSRGLPVKALARHALPFTVLAFLGAALSGSLLFLAHAADLINNRMFIYKLGLITLAGVNAAIFHTGPYAKAAQWDVGQATPGSAKLCAALSLLLWLAVIACGRWIAYA